MHSPQRIIGLFPEWYAPPQPDWPAHARQTGFPLYDEGEVQQLSPEAETFLAEGPNPIVFTPGSGMQHAHRFFAASVEACRRLGRRGALLTPFAEQIPDGLPDGVRHFAYLPFSRALPHAAALVHHGGIGTMSQALAAGVPQLITPYAFDQPDTAARIRRLGVGDAIQPRSYNAETATAALKRLLSSDAAAVEARKCAELIRRCSPLDETCRLIEEAAVSDSLKHK
jgi:UDP:flavonoid glycosyltransferase YjiC (YdhE family)